MGFHDPAAQGANGLTMSQRSLRIAVLLVTVVIVVLGLAYQVLAIRG